MFSRPLFALLMGGMAACGISLAGTALDEEPPGGDAAPYEPADARPPSDASRADVVTPADASEDAADAGLPVVVRLNINGPQHTGIDFPGEWAPSAVPDVCGPNHNVATTPAVGTADGPLFVGEAFGNPATCAVGDGGLASGKYRVRLYFAEVYFGPGCAADGGVGSRVFDIVIEGATKESNLDVFAESGGCLVSTTSDAARPVIRTFDVDVVDGTIDISLPASVNNGKISALEVFGPL